MTRLLAFCGSIILACLPLAQTRPAFYVAAFDRARVLKAADEYLSEKPVTVTAEIKEQPVDYLAARANPP